MSTRKQVRGGNTYASISMAEATGGQDVGFGLREMAL